MKAIINADHARVRSGRHSVLVGGRNAGAHGDGAGGLLVAPACAAPISDAFTTNLVVEATGVIVQRSPQSCAAQVVD
jgi:hypothetical protein